MEPFLLAIPCGLVLGFALGAMGGGGAVLSLPVLIYVLGQDVHSATTASLVIVAGSALVSAGKLGRDGLVCWRVALLYAATATVGTLFGTIANQAVGARLLLLLFVPVLLAAAFAIWWKSGSEDPKAVARGHACPPLRPRVTGPLGLGVGLLTGFFGVGGGFIIVPTLAVVLQMSMRQAIATSLVVIFLVSMVGLGGHLVAGSTPDWGLTLTLTAAGAGGALLGATVAGYLPQALLARIFASLLTCVALYLLLDALVLGGAAAS